VSKFLKEIWVSKYEFKATSNIPKYAHKTRTAEIVARWQCIGTIWEIKPIVVKNFSLKSRLWFFEINLDKLKDMIHTITKVSELSDFQSSSFDISFLIDKNLEWLKLKNIIAKTNIKVIEKVEVFDIYENEEKLKWNRSISFKVFLQKMDSEINDKEKNKLIEEIIKKATKFWALHK
jgi:phenylalanyl-tRNA synthetase beta chain